MPHFMPNSEPSSSPVPRWKSGLVHTLSLLLIWQPMLLSAQPITPTHGTNGRPTLDQAANGVPVVNIQNPNGKGVSQNFYNDLNVSDKGLVLNNSQTLTQTQLGGYIEGNPNLKNGSASLILNEVIGQNPSNLAGYIEVGGARADVVVANPNGISCNGCGFINTNHATLTTGQSIMEDGELRGFDVQGGAVSILGNGLNASNTERFDIIARSVTLAGELHADSLNIVTGQQKVDRQTLATSNATSDGDKPQFAIDSSALGGMYANRIRLIANEDGVGVKLDAPVAAQNGDLQLSANGKIQHSDLAATGNIAIDTNQHDVSGTGTVWAQTDLSVKAADYTNSGYVVADGKADIQATTVTNTGTLGGREALTVEADAILNDQGGALLSENDINLSADQVTNRLADIYTSGNLTINGNDGESAEKLENRSGRIEAEGDVAVQAEQILNVRDVLDWEDVLVDAKAQYFCIECQHTNFTMRYTFTEEFVRELDEATTGRSLLVAGGDMSLTGERLFNETSDILAYGDMNLDVDRIDNIGLHSGEYVLINHYKTYLSDNEHVANVRYGIEPYNKRNYFGGARYWGSGGNKKLEHMALFASQNNPNYDPDNFLRREDNWVVKRTPHIGEEIVPLESAEILGANIISGGNLDMGDAAVTNGDLGHKQGGGVSEEELIAVGKGAGRGGNDMDSYLEGANGGLFSIADPNHPYLIETNPFFSTRDGFLGSEYLLNRLGWDPNGAMRLLGDGFYEQQLIRQQVVDLTGRALLDDEYVDANAQYRALLDNGLFAAEELELTVGVALSPDQVNALTEDMVWMVEKEVAGEIVLVPQLYLSPQSAVIDDNGALIASGGDMVNDGGSIVNSGTIHIGGDADFDLNEDGLQNLGGTISGEGVLDIDSEGDVRNISGTISAREVALNSAQDIINRRLAYQSEITDGTGWREWHTEMGAAATIEGADSVDLDAEGDIRITGSRIRGGNVALNAEGDIVVDTVADQSGRKGNYHGGKLSESRVRHIGSEITATMNLLASAGNDFSLIGSDLASDGGVQLSAGNDLLVASVANSDSYDFKVRHDGETSHNIQRSVRQQGASITGGGDVVMESGNDLTVIASRLEAGEDLSLMGKGDISILAALDSDYRYSYEEDDKWYGSKITTEEKYNETARVAELSAAGNVQINALSDPETGQVTTWNEAKGDVLLEGTNIQSGGDSLVYAGNDLLVTAAQTRSFHEKETRREYSGVAKAAMATASFAAMGVVPNEYMAAMGVGDINIKGDEGKGSRKTRLARADIQSAGDIMLLSGNDTTLVAADLFLNNLYAEAGLNGEEGKGNIALVGAHETSENWAYESSTSLGVDFSGGKMSFARQYEHREKESRSDFVGTDVAALGGAALKSAGDITMMGSSLNSNGNVRLIAGGDVNMLVGVDSLRKEVSTTEREFKVEGTASGNSVELFAGYEEDRHTEIREQKTAVGSQISGSNIEIDSGDDITIIGGILQASSHPEAEAGSTGNIMLDAEGDITTLASVSESMLKVIDENFRTGVAIGAQENVSAAANAVNNVGNQQGAVNTGSAALQAVDAVQGARSGGVSGSAGYVAEWSKQESEDTSQTANSTLIFAENDLSFISGGDQRHVGTQASAGNNLIVKSDGDVTIESAQNTTSHEDKSTNASVNVGLGSDSGVSVTAAGGYAKNRSGQVQQVNAHFIAGNQATLDVGNDLTLAGAVVSGNTMDANIGGDLTVESRQDTSYTRGESAQGSVSVGAGSFSLSLSGSKTEGDSAWVYEQSGLLASETANIYVEDHTSLVGGVINSESGDLTLDTGTFSYQDIQDYDHFESMSLGFGAGVPQGQTQGPTQTASAQTLIPGVNMNNVTAGYQNREREQITRATVGEGAVTVRGDQDAGGNSLAGLNRDMSQAQEITKDEEDDYNLYVSDTSLQGLGVLDRDNNKHNSSRLDQLKDTFNINLAVSEIGESSVAGVGDVDNALADGLTLGQAKPDATGSRGLLDDQTVDDVAGKVGDGLLAAGQTVVNRDEQGGWHLLGVGKGNDTTDHYDRNQLARLKVTLAREVQLAQQKGEMNSEQDLVDLVNNLTDNDADLNAAVLASLASEVADTSLDAGLYEQAGSGLAGAAKGVHDEGRDYVGLNIDGVNLRDARDVMSALGEESYHARDGADDSYANLFGSRFGYLWDKTNREEGRHTGGSRTVEEWRTNDANRTHLKENSRQLAIADPLDLEFRQFKRKEASALDEARYLVANQQGLSEKQKRDTLLKLEAKACAAVLCAEGLPENDPYREVLSSLQAYGEQLAESEGDIRKDLDGLGVKTAYEWQHGRSKGKTELFDYNGLDDSVTDAASHYTDEAVTTVNTKIEGGYQLTVGFLAADAAAMSGSEDMAGFAEHQFATADGLFGKEYQSLVGERVLNSMSEETFEESPSYVGSAALLGAEAVPIAVAVKKTGKAVDKAQDALSSLNDAAKRLVREKQAAGAAGKADELTDSLGSKSQARVDEEMVGLPENFESWVSRKDLEDHIKNSDIGLAEDWDASQVHDYVTNIKKGERPDPDSYLDQGYMNIHLSEFEGGASRFMTKKNIDKYGIGQKDGTSFVMTRKQADQIISSANGDAKVMEKALGLPEGFLDGNELIRVDIPNPGKLNLRIPSGNEAGASKQWIPGGRLPDGNLEAVIDAGDISPKEYEIVPLDF